MTFGRWMVVLALGGALGLGMGCRKSAETAAPKPEPRAQTERAKPTAPAPPPPARQAALPAPTQQVQSVTVTATNTTPAESAKAQEIIEAARKLVAEGKWPEVLQKLTELKDLPLGPEHEKALLDLKEQVEKMLRDALGK